MQDQAVNKSQVDLWQFLFVIACVVLIGFGVYFRFQWRDWSEGTNLHPDEYGLTNTVSQLYLPDSANEYFNTRISPISPYNKYDVAGQPIGNGPDNRMRWGQWPIIIIRYVGQLVEKTGYDEIRLVGRRLSAVADTLTLIVLFLIGKRLFDWKIGLLASTLGSLTVLQIQQSHFMTVDTFALFFTTSAIYFCIHIARTPMLIRQDNVAKPNLVINSDIWIWLVLFGISFGMAVASKINLAVLAGMLPVAVFVSLIDIKLHYREDLSKLIQFAGIILAIGAIVSVITFRLTQPMSFRAVTGDTTVFTLHFNQDWMDSMEVSRMESAGLGGGPPAEQWTHRIAILFPWKNMVFWGMGAALGITAWVGVIAAVWLFLRNKLSWRTHLVPLSWTVFFFLFMGTRWVKSMRYFLPIYPLLCLYAAWALIMLIRKAFLDPAYKKVWLQVVSVVCLITVMTGTFIWSTAFTTAVYENRHTRIRTTEWMLEHIPGAVNFIIQTEEGEIYAPVAVPNQYELIKENIYSQSTRMPEDGKVVGLYFPRIQNITDSNKNALLIHYTVLDGDKISKRLNLDVIEEQEHIRIDFGEGAFFVQKDDVLNLELVNESEDALLIQKVMLSNESWDEGLPVRFKNWDPFGQLYLGNTMEVRWMDTQEKKEMFLQRLAVTDYLIVPSQRAVWSASRMPLMYPMTMKYYESLFKEELGFELIAEFQAPMKFGDLYISDVGGTWAVGEYPELPIFNFNALAAEEAFSVYDHPPVWIFKKTDDFDLYKVQAILDSVDLSKVVLQSPRDATFYKTIIEK
jgi:hypothetical protein